MCRKVMTIVVTVLLLANIASAALEYSWDFDDGTDMEWTSVGVGCTLEQYETSNWGLEMNNNGATEHLKWEIQKEITPGEQYNLSFDYKAGGESAHVKMYFWDSSWGYLGSQTVYDYLVWGSTPSLNRNGGDWTHRDVDVDAAYVDAKYVTIQLNFKAYWGQTIFDEIAISLAVVLEYSWDFDDGTDMEWTQVGAGCTLEQYETSNWGLGMNNNGATEHLKWEIQKEITPGKRHKLAFDYTAGGEGAYVKMYFWDSSCGYLGSQTVYDYLVWGSTPSLNRNGGDWTHRDVDADAAYVDAKYVTIQLNFKAHWGQTIFDEIAIWSFKTPVRHNIVTQYWTWFTEGPDAPHWSNLYLDYGVPALGYYSSYDPIVARSHIGQMLANGANVLSVGYINKAGDGAMWCGLDPDQAFQDGVMQASNFGDIEFCISYDISTRAMMVHNCENGYQWGYPEGLDVLPGVLFTDPAVGSTSSTPSFNFNLTDTSNGKYIYDELIEYDFKHLAETYFNQPNYFKINDQCVVTVYATERFNNGGVGDITDGFYRAWKRVRETMYDLYGHKLYLVGHFVTRTEAAANRQDYFRTAGFYQHYDAVSSWNVFDRHYSLNSLVAYTEASLSAHDKFRPAALLATRDYRQWLSEPAKSAYGPSSTNVDFVPCLSYSFYDSADSFYSSITGNSEVTAQAQMIEDQRDQSILAEENATIVYQVAFNQWGEGQIMEATASGTPKYPGCYEWTYLGVTKGILGPGW